MNKSVNLLDSLNIIESDNLLCDLIGKVAPDFEYDWDSTAGYPRERSQAIFVKLNDFQRHHPTQHCKLATNLSTIALINEAECGAYLKKQISANPTLHERYEKYPFEIKASPDYDSHLAAWLLLQTLSLPSGSMELDQAKKTWDEVVAVAIKRNSSVRYRTYSIEDPTVRTEEDWNNNVTGAFLDYLRLLLLPRRINADAPVPVGYIPQKQDHYYQFFFKIPGHPRLTSQIRDDGLDYETDRDRNSGSIEIQFYPNINIVKVSDEAEINNSEIARHFIEDVLGTKIDNSEKNKVYTLVLDRFRSKDILVDMRDKMTDKAKEAKADFWIEEMDFSYGALIPDKRPQQGVFTEIHSGTAEATEAKVIQTFPPMTIHSCTQEQNVYDILRQSFRDEFTSETMTIHRVKLIFRIKNKLPSLGDSCKKTPKTEFANYEINISDTKRRTAFPPETPALHRKIIEE